MNFDVGIKKDAFTTISTLKAHSDRTSRSMTGLKYHRKDSNYNQDNLQLQQYFDFGQIESGMQTHRVSKSAFRNEKAPFNVNSERFVVIKN